MDLVSEYVAQLGLTENAARGLAGQLLGLFEDTAREKVSYGLAARIRDAVPEMTQWQLSAPTLRPGALSLHDLTPVALLDPKAERDALLHRFQVPAANAPIAQALAVSFLATRVEPSVIAALARALP